MFLNDKFPLKFTLLMLILLFLLTLAYFSGAVFNSDDGNIPTTEQPPIERSVAGSIGAHIDSLGRQVPQPPKVDVIVPYLPALRKRRSYSDTSSYYTSSPSSSRSSSRRQSGGEQQQHQRKSLEKCSGRGCNVWGVPATHQGSQGVVDMNAEGGTPQFHYRVMTGSKGIECAKRTVNNKAELRY